MSRISKDRKHPKVTTRVQLGEYHEDLDGDYIDVWVNINRDLKNALLEGQQESLEIAQLPLDADKERDERVAALVDTMKDLHAEWWGLPREDIDYLYDTDVPLYQWIVARALKAREDYEDDRKNVEKG